jgi:regulator of protease activity HflC (stomatin/prohibitin superfamily)
MKTIIQENERGILFKNGVASRWLKPGKHRFWSPTSTLRVQRYDGESVTDVLTPELDRLAPEGDLTRLDVPEGSLALIMAKGFAQSILGPGSYGLWQTRQVVSARLIEATPLKVELPDAFVALAPSALISQVHVQRFQRALVYVNGELADVLGAGRHLLSVQNRQVQVLISDMREQELPIVGQELLTQDKVTLRLTLLAKFKVVDPVLAHETVQVLRDALYSEVQLAARHFVAKHTVEQLLERQNEAVDEMAATVRARTAEWGIEVPRVDIKDIVLPGEMKTILNRVIEAQKEAEANNIMRREETAATRSLANTAKMLERNPTLMRLKELEAIKEIAGRVDHLTVVAGKGAEFLMRGEG